MPEGTRLWRMLAAHGRRKYLPEFLATTASFFGLKAEDIVVTDLDRMGALQGRIQTKAWGVEAADGCTMAQVTSFLVRLSELLAAPAWLVNSLPGQEAVGAVSLPLQNLLPVWVGLIEQLGFVDLVSADESSWVTITWDDHSPETPYTIEAGGGWATLVETTHRNLWIANRNICSAFVNGEAWLENLPYLIADCKREWELDLEPKTRGNYSFVIPCGDHILKLLPPGETFNCELATMLAWNGYSAARIDKHDAARGAMLIERLRPGTELTALYHEGRDEEATEIACALMSRLAIPLPNSGQIPLPRLGGVRGGLAAPDTPADQQPTPIPTATDRAAELAGLRRRFNGGTGPFPPHLVEAAESLFRDLLASQGAPHLIHADLHHENVLESERGWLAIDPHALIAEREFEAYAWLNNPIGLSKNPDLKAIAHRRLDQISDLTGFDRDRIRSWGVACAVLSAWWSFDEHGTNYEADLAVADVLLAS